MRPRTRFTLALLLLSAVGCGYQPANGESCGSHVGQLYCEPLGNTFLFCKDGTWIDNDAGQCSKCQHISDDSSAVVCDGVSVAEEGEPCEKAGTGACSDAFNQRELGCTAKKWTLVNDCAASGRTCTKLADGKLGCS